MALWRMLTAVCVHVFLHMVVTHSTTIHNTFTSQTALSDRMYLSSVLPSLDFRARSKLDCARTCATSDLCVTFTFTKESGACRGHSQKQTTGDPSDPVTGARTYGMELEMPEWLDSSCANDADCLNLIPTSLRQMPWNKMPECFYARCLCPVPTFYSVSQRLCHLECPVSDLQASYSRYQQLAVNVAGFPMDCLGVAHCQTVCASRTDCYFFSTTNTYDSSALRAVYPQGTTDVGTVTQQGRDMYHRHCA